MNPPEYVDKDKSLIERYLFTPGKLSSLTNYFAKVNKNIRYMSRIIYLE